MQITGNLVTLTPFEWSDLTSTYVEWLNDPMVVRFSNQRFTTHTQESCEHYVRSFEGSPNLFFSIRLKETTKAIGTMTAYVSAVHGTADMGILIGDRNAWGKGIGTDAWKSLLLWLLTSHGLRKVTAGTLNCNKAMLGLMLKSGMHHEATRRAQEIVEDSAQDILYFARFHDKY